MRASYSPVEFSGPVRAAFSPRSWVCAPTRACVTHPVPGTRKDLPGCLSAVTLPWTYPPDATQDLTLRSWFALVGWIKTGRIIVGLGDPSLSRVAVYLLDTAASLHHSPRSPHGSQVLDTVHHVVRTPLPRSCLRRGGEGYR